MINNLDVLIAEKQKTIRVAQGLEKADVVIKNATYANFFTNTWEHGDIAITQGRIAGIGSYSGIVEISADGKWVAPSFIDGHIHLESAMVTPCEFAQAVLPHGTGAVVADPHEIANVLGVTGIEYMLKAAQNLPLDVWLMAPSCVPATAEDESGATLTHEDLLPILKQTQVLGLAEMMNYPGVLAGDEGVLAKLVVAEQLGKPIDGHAPGLAGASLCAYAGSGIASDHECTTLEEARDKLRLGQWVMIREGTAAKNLQALAPLLRYPFCDRCLFVCDDKHPESLIADGHMDYMIRKAVALGADPLIALKSASYNAAHAFGLRNHGAIAPGYAADIVILNDITDFGVACVLKHGKIVYDGKNVAFSSPPVDEALYGKVSNTFNISPVTPQAFKRNEPAGVIELVEGQIITRDGGVAKSVDITKNLLKIAVLERHRHTGHIGIGYIKGYGLTSGAVATSIAHDSHNIIVVGCSDDDMACAVNDVIAMQGGIAISENKRIVNRLRLSIAGLISTEPLMDVSTKLEEMKQSVRRLGVSAQIDPFMTLSFISLPVIPSLRILTTGVFDVTQWKYKTH